MAGKKSISERFWSKVNIRGPEDCWPWIGGFSSKGYGSFRITHRVEKAHRFAWELTNGPIPDGLHACHHCDVPSCCNVRHLFLGTNADNIRDCMSKGRRAKSHGEHNGMARLTPELVAFIRSTDEDAHSIARRLGLDHTTIWQARRGKTWKHIR